MFSASLRIIKIDRFCSPSKRFVTPPFIFVTVMIGLLLYAAHNAAAHSGFCSAPMRSETGDSNSDSAQSPAKVQEILDAAIKAMGSLQKIQSLDNITIEYDGLRSMIHQSRSPEGPPDKEPSVGKVIIDRKKVRLFAHTRNSYPGIGSFASNWVATANDGFMVDALKNHHGTEAMLAQKAGAARQWSNAIRWMPPLLLLQAWENPTSLEWLETRQEGQISLQAMRFSQPNHGSLILLFDAATHLLVRYEFARSDGILGEMIESASFYNYKDFDGLKLPTKRIERYNDLLAREVTLKISLNTTLDEGLFNFPQGYSKPDVNAPDSERIKKLAEGVYLDTHMNVMFVEFKDYVFVMDCPGNFHMSKSTIDAIRKTIPDKPIKYVATSHTHDDHGGGARAYFHEGITLLIPPGNVNFYKRLAKMKQIKSPDPLSTSQREPIIETFTKKYVLSDETRTVELHNIGPTPHANDVVIAYLPKEKILFQADHFFIPLTGGGVNAALPITDWFAKKLKALKIDFRLILDSHHDRVATLEEFQETLRKGGYKPF